jgi:hypothetical protein
MGLVVRLTLVVLVVGCGFKSGNALVVVGDGPDIDARPDSMLDARADAPRDATPDAVPDAPPDAPPPAITLRQINYSDSGSTVTQRQVVMAMPQLAGDLNVITIGWYPSASTPVLSDSAGNTYSVGVPLATQGTENLIVYYSCGILASASNTITVTFTPGTQPDVHVAEYTGIQTSSCLDVGASHQDTGSAMDVMVTTTHARDLLFSTTFQLNQTSVGDASYTSRGINNFGDLVQDRVVTTAGTYHATATQNSAGDEIIDLLAFKGQ